MTGIIKIRTARKQHRCDGYPCREPIEPGEVYEDHRQPPGDYDWGSYARWVRHKVHAPRQGWPDGCELAAAYHEQARRGQEEGAR